VECYIWDMHWLVSTAGSYMLPIILIDATPVPEPLLVLGPIGYTYQIRTLVTRSACCHEGSHGGRRGTLTTPLRRLTPHLIAMFINGGPSRAVWADKETHTMALPGDEHD